MHASHMNREEFLDAFQAITVRMFETARKKNHDYTGDDEDPFSNFDAVEKFGICSAETGLLVRMMDKYKRIVGLMKPGVTALVEDESIDDTLLDLANYAVLLHLRRLARKRATKLVAPMDKAFQAAGSLQ